MMLTESAGSVAALHAKPGHEIAPATFAAAVDLLASVPEKAAALAALADSLYPESSGERGRPAAKVGDVRGYKVQQVGDSDPFIRLPVSLLGLAKGQTATVTFDNGVIRVKV
jgi:hypothetical protein